MSYHHMFFVFRERISTGEVTRRMHMEEWSHYTSYTLLTPSFSSTTSFSSTLALRESDAVFERLRAEIALLEQRSADFKRILGELTGLVEKVKEMDRAAAAGRVQVPEALVKKIEENRGFQVVFAEEEEGWRQSEPPRLPISSSKTSMPPLPGQPRTEPMGRFRAIRSRFGL